MKKYLLFSMALCMISTAWAQYKVTGKITSADDGEGLPGVTVIEKGTTNGTITDYDGSYTINLSKNPAILSFSFVGYITQEIQVGTESVVDVALQIDIEELAEVVVIGYGQAKKEDLTGAVSKIDTKDFNKGVITSPQNLLVGKVAGVQVTTASGAPGAGATIRIRGGASLTASNDPLIVIDGFPIDNTNVSGTSNPLATINPSDIESFTVLKDASATAIYGSRASNGVIIITTKKGSEGKPKLSLNSTVSVGTPVKYVDVLTGDEYRNLINSLYEEGFSGINQSAIDLLGDQNTNWQKKIFHTAIAKDINFNVAGSAGKIPYRFSYGWTDQDGILKTTNTKRHSLALNLNPTFFNKSLKVNVNAKQSFSQTNFGDAGAVGAAVTFDPTQPVRSGDESKFGGYFAFTDADGQPITFTSNPVAMLELRRNIGNVNRFIGNVQLDYTLPFFKDINANLNLGIDRSSTEGIDDAMPGTTWTYSTYGTDSRMIDYTADNHSRLMDFYLRYKKEVGVHDVELTAGHSYQYWYRENFTYDRSSDGSFVLTDSLVQKNENLLISFFGRLNYIYNDKYLVTGTLRYDGSSRFSKANRWGMFPSLALAWRINQEDFMKAVPIISDLKLRAGVGVTGQQDITSATNPYYPYIATYRSSIGGASYQFGDQFISTVRPDAYDSDIKWEQTTTYNVGLDFGILSDRFYGSIELYTRYTKDLINTIAIPSGSNLSNYLTTNVGNTESRGVELTLNGTVIDKKDFNWKAGFNFTRYTNKITKLTLTDNEDFQGVAVGSISGGTGNTVQIHSVDYPAYSFYVYQQLYDSNGKPVEGLYADRTGDGGEVISNTLNKYRYHSPNPDFMIGVNSRAEYKNFDFSFSGRFSFGNYVYNNVQSGATMGGLYVSTGYFSNITKAASERGFINPQYWSDMFVENASFFKLDNVSVGYNIPKFVVDGLKARVSLTVQNALIITKYSGIDPEVSGGIDNNIYPRPRTYLFGLNLNF